MENIWNLLKNIDWRKQSLFIPSVVFSVGFSLWAGDGGFAPNATGYHFIQSVGAHLMTWSGVVGTVFSVTEFSRKRRDEVAGFLDWLFLLVSLVSDFALITVVYVRRSGYEAFWMPFFLVWSPLILLVFSLLDFYGVVYEHGDYVALKPDYEARERQSIQQAQMEDKRASRAMEYEALQHSIQVREQELELRIRERELEMQWRAFEAQYSETQTTPVETSEISNDFNETQIETHAPETIADAILCILNETCDISHLNRLVLEQTGLQLQGCDKGERQALLAMMLKEITIDVETAMKYKDKLAEIFDVSESTLWRDLKEIEVQ